MYRIQKQAKSVKKELRNIHVEAQGPGVRVIVSGEQEVISIDIAQDVDRVRLPEILKDCMNRGLKKSQIVSAEKMQGVMGEMGLGGLNKAA